MTIPEMKFQSYIISGFGEYKKHLYMITFLKRIKISITYPLSTFQEGVVTEQEKIPNQKSWLRLSRLSTKKWFHLVALLYSQTLKHMIPISLK